MIQTAPRIETSGEDILVLAPTGQDAHLIAQALARSGIHADTFSEADALIARLASDAGALVLAEEALTPKAVDQINQVLAAQEPWSDLPVIVMTTSGETTLASARALRAFSPAGNVTLLERPFRQITLVSAIQGALRARRRQYQVRSLLESQIEATRVRDEFISVASHELKTPLTSLKLQAQMSHRYMKNQPPGPVPPERVMRLIDTTRSQVDRLTRLVEDMLDVSRISLGKLMIVRSPFDLVEMVRSHADFFTQQAQAVGCELRVHPSESVIGDWDHFRLEQVLSNLLTNAIRYAPGTPIDISIERGLDRVRVIVTDQGPGIAPENQRRIFERFERAGSAISPSGLGLGLYISREIATAHGGTLDVESEPGRGASFILELPISTLRT